MGANKVAEYRMKWDITQKDLAKMVGVTHEYISQIERGRRPGMNTALKLARIFDSTIDELFFENEPNTQFCV